MELTKENIDAVKAKADEAKTLYLKWVGAAEVLESLMENAKEQAKIAKKEAKKKK